MIIYLIVAISVIISPAFPFIFFNIIDIFNKYVPLAYGSTAYIFGGWVGIIAIVISFIFFGFYKTKQAIILSIIGCCLLGFNLIYVSVLILVRFHPPEFLIQYGYFEAMVAWILLCVVDYKLFKIIFNEKATDMLLVKKTILDLGIRFDRLDIREIGEKCRVNKSAIIKVIKSMIQNREIYAEYFSNTNTVAFNKQANIDEIDNLISLYEKWEDNKIEKI
jgi:hypothetical protein